MTRVIEKQASFTKEELQDIFNLQGKKNSEPIEIDGVWFERGLLLFRKFRGMLDTLTGLYRGILEFIELLPLEEGEDDAPEANLKRLLADEPERRGNDDDTETFDEDN